MFVSDFLELTLNHRFGSHIAERNALLLIVQSVIQLNNFKNALYFTRRLIKIMLSTLILLSKLNVFRLFSYKLPSTSYICIYLIVYVKLYSINCNNNISDIKLSYRMFTIKITVRENE